MVKGKTPATTDLATIREQTASVLDVFQRVEDSCSQAQEWIRDVVEAIDIGHQMLHPPESGAPTTSLRMPKSNFEYLRPSSTESATDPTELGSNGLPPNKSSPNNSQLRVHCLGKFRVYRGNRPIEGWRNNKAKGVFKLLLLNLGKPLPKDIFMEALWQNTSVQSATNSFRVAVHELRQRLAFTSADGRNLDYIITDGSNYSINPEADIWLDFKEFESRWKGSRILEKTGRANEAIAAYRKAESLYQGDLLEEDIYEDWTLLKREFLLDIYLAMLGKISAYHLKTGDYDACIESSQKLLAKDRCREDAYQYIIKCYSNMGFRSQALRWYALCEGTLRRELDCPVSPETRALAHSLSGGGNILGETVLILR